MNSLDSSTLVFSDLDLSEYAMLTMAAIAGRQSIDETCFQFACHSLCTMKLGVFYQQ